MGRPFEDDVGAASKAVWSAIEDAAAHELVEELRPNEGMLVIFDGRSKADRSRTARASSPPGPRADAR